MRAASFLAAICAVFVLAGCSSRGEGIVGTWEILGGPSPAAMTFNSDGTFVSRAASSEGRQITGKYEKKGDKLIFTTQNRTATIRVVSPDEMVLTGDDGITMTLKRR